MKGPIVTLLVAGLIVASSAAQMMVGGARDAQPDKAAEDAAQFAVSQLSAKANAGTLTLQRIASYKTQVVAGINHIMTLDTKDGSGASKVWEVKVWEKLPGQQQNGAYELTEYKAAAGPVAESDEGQWTGAAQAALVQINARSNSLFPYQLDQVLSATPANDGETVDLLLSVKRGDRMTETFKVVLRPAGDHYQLVTFSQEQPGTAPS